MLKEEQPQTNLLKLLEGTGSDSKEGNIFETNDLSKKHLL
jgi:hypothetical protein